MTAGLLGCALACAGPALAADLTVTEAESQIWQIYSGNKCISIAQVEQVDVLDIAQSPANASVHAVVVLNAKEGTEPTPACAAEFETPRYAVLREATGNPAMVRNTYQFLPTKTGWKIQSPWPYSASGFRGVPKSHLEYERVSPPQGKMPSLGVADGSRQIVLTSKPGTGSRKWLAELYGGTTGLLRLTSTAGPAGALPRLGEMRVPLAASGGTCRAELQLARIKLAEATGSCAIAEFGFFVERPPGGRWGIVIATANEPKAPATRRFYAVDFARRQARVLAGWDNAESGDFSSMGGRYGTLIDGLPRVYDFESGKDYQVASTDAKRVMQKVVAAVASRERKRLVTVPSVDETGTYISIPDVGSFRTYSDGLKPGSSR